MKIYKVPEKKEEISFSYLYRLCCSEPEAVWRKNIIPEYSFDSYDPRFENIKGDPDKLLSFYLHAKFSEKVATDNYPISKSITFDYRDLIEVKKAIEYAELDLGKEEKLLGVSDRMLNMFYSIDKLIENVVSPPPGNPILLLGETGTGKELVARAIWRKLGGDNNDRPFKAINCSAIPPHLIYSELFGHTEGSFTGAIADKQGIISQAKKGVVFLDEIGYASFDVQAALLRVINEKSYEILGGTESKEIEAQIICGTSRPLYDPGDRDIEDNNIPKFLEELYYRLSHYQIRIPSLKERITDIPLLLYHFAKKKSSGKTVRVKVNILLYFLMYDWPGNVRELSTVISNISMRIGKSEIRNLLNACEILLQELELPKSGKEIIKLIEEELKNIPRRVGDPNEEIKLTDLFFKIDDQLKLLKDNDEIVIHGIKKGMSFLIRNFINKRLTFTKIGAPSEIASRYKNNLNHVDKYYSTLGDYDEAFFIENYYEYYFGGIDDLPRINIYSLCMVIKGMNKEVIKVVNKEVIKVQSGLDPWTEIKKIILGKTDNGTNSNEPLSSITEDEPESKSEKTKRRECSLALPDNYDEALKLFKKFFLRPRWEQCGQNKSELANSIGKARDTTRKWLKECKIISD